MAKNGIKIKELARELGVTSRDVITRCREEGIPAQNSIARLRPEAERAVRAFFSGLTPRQNVDGATDELTHDNTPAARVRPDRFGTLR